MKYQLKLAKFTLAQQARLLKKLEKNKVKGASKFYFTRTTFVRSEARAHHLAHGFLRGRTMNEMELPLRALDQGHITSIGLTRTAPNWERVEELVLAHGLNYFASEQELQQRFTEFKDSWTVVSL